MLAASPWTVSSEEEAVLPSDAAGAPAPAAAAAAAAKAVVCTALWLMARAAPPPRCTAHTTVQRIAPLPLPPLEGAASCVSAPAPAPTMPCDPRNDSSAPLAKAHRKWYTLVQPLRPHATAAPVHPHAVHRVRSACFAAAATPTSSPASSSSSTPFAHRQHSACA